MKGRFLNISGYSLHRESVQPYWWLFRKTLYHFELSPTDPLTFEMEDGGFCQADRSFMTDWGSTPASLQLVVPKDRFLGYLFHDSAYCHKGLWFAERAEGPFKFCRMNRLGVDRLCLLEMIEADPFGPRCWEPGLIYGVVRACGGLAWRLKRDEGETEGE